MELARFSRFCAEHNYSWREIISDGDLSIPGLKQESIKELYEFIQDMNYWIKQSYNVSTQQLIERLMAKSKFISRALASKNRAFDIQCLKTFFDFVKRETAKAPFSSLTHLLHQVDLMYQNNLALRTNTSVISGSGINLMTVYASKGLEFEHVFLIGCTGNIWEKRKKSLPFGLDKILPGEPSFWRGRRGEKVILCGTNPGKTQRHH